MNIQRNAGLKIVKETVKRSTDDPEASPADLKAVAYSAVTFVSFLIVLIAGIFYMVL